MADICHQLYILMLMQSTVGNLSTICGSTIGCIWPGLHQSEFCLSKHPICQHMTKNKCDTTLKILSNFLPIAKIPPMFKEAELLPRRLPNFGKVDNFVYLTIKLSFTPVM